MYLSQLQNVSLERHVQYVCFVFVCSFISLLTLLNQKTEDKNVSEGPKQQSANNNRSSAPHGIRGVLSNQVSR